MTKLPATKLCVRKMVMCVCVCDRLCVKDGVTKTARVDKRWCVTKTCVTKLCDKDVC